MSLWSVPFLFVVVQLQLCHMYFFGRYALASNILVNQHKLVTYRANNVVSTFN